MPCGTGKSLTAYWIAEALTAKTILVAVPSLALVRQSLADWTRESLTTTLFPIGFVFAVTNPLAILSAMNLLAKSMPWALAADLVRQRCVVIVAGGVDAAFAAKAATATIPIIFATGDDPLRSGLVGSFNRPGGNITGVFSVSASMEGKHLGLLREVVPTAAVIGMLVNPTSPGSERQERETQAAAQALGQQLHVFKASGERDIDNVFATLTQYRIGALLIAANALFTGQRDQLVALAARHAMPVLHYTREFAEAGGLMSYGSSLTDAYRQVGVYVGRVLKGEKPADFQLDVDQVRASDQSQDRQSAWPHRSYRCSARRRGDRMNGDVRFWHKADIPSCTAHVRFWG